MNCFRCKKEFGEIDGYKVIHLNLTWAFCGRLCLTEWIAPEITKGIVPRQWIPTAEEDERMSQ